MEFVIFITPGGGERYRNFSKSFDSSRSYPWNSVINPLTDSHMVLTSGALPRHIPSLSAAFMFGRTTSTVN